MDASRTSRPSTTVLNMLFRLQNRNLNAPENVEMSLSSLHSMPPRLSCEPRHYGTLNQGVPSTQGEPTHLTNYFSCKPTSFHHSR